MAYVISYKKENEKKFGLPTALINGLAFQGINLEEVLAFGLLCCYDFKYYKNSSGLPSRAISGIEFIPDGYYLDDSMVSLNWKIGSDFSWEEIKKYLDKGIPVVILSNSPLSEEYMLLTNYNGDEVTSWDGNRLRVLSITELQKLMGNVNPFLKSSNIWAPVNTVKAIDLQNALKKALLETAFKMLYPQNEFTGILGIRKYAADIKVWKEQIKDLRWCIMQAQKMITGEGTDGGNNRFYYSAFLGKAKEILPEFRKTDLDSRMEYCGRLWQELASWFGEYITTNDNRIFRQCAMLVTQIAREEEGVFREIYKLLTGKIYRPHVLIETPYA